MKSDDEAKFTRKKTKITQTFILDTFFRPSKFMTISQTNLVTEAITGAECQNESLDLKVKKVKYIYEII